MLQLVGGLSPLRYGQALFNDTYRVAPDLADKVRATEADCFYLDERVPAFLRALVAAAREEGWREERERNTHRDENGNVLHCPRCGMSTADGYTEEELYS